MGNSRKRIIVAFPHGFCVGVSRAVKSARAAVEKFGRPVYCLNQIVHNEHVVESLGKKGVVFVPDLDKVPRGSVLLLSAHGVAPSVLKAAHDRRLRVVDATCPFVHKVHAEVRHYAQMDYTVFLVGYRNHEEVVGVAGEAPKHLIVVENAEEAGKAQPRDPAKTAVVTQTTLSREQTGETMAALRSRFPKLVEPAGGDVCYATRNRQKAVAELSGQAEYVVVLGSANSSNSRRLVEVAQSAGCNASLLSNLKGIVDLPLDGIRTLGLTSGASTPESFLERTLAALAGYGFSEIETLHTAKEDAAEFRLPPELL